MPSTPPATGDAVWDTVFADAARGDLQARAAAVS